MLTRLHIPPGYAETRTQHDYSKTAKHVCPECGWSGYVRMDFKGQPLDPCPHRDSSPFEEYGGRFAA